MAGRRANTIENFLKLNQAAPGSDRQTPVQENYDVQEAEDDAPSSDLGKRPAENGGEHEEAEMINVVDPVSESALALDKTPIKGRHHAFQSMSHHARFRQALQRLEVKKHTIDIDFDSVKTHLDTHLPLNVVSPDKTGTKPIMLTARPVVATAHGPDEDPKPIPEPSFRIIKPQVQKKWPIQSEGVLIKFQEKSAEQLDEEVEYDMDEEDIAWLALVNKERKSVRVGPVSFDLFELCMDRLEKESHFLSQAKGVPQLEVDDDAVCCICNDGDTEQGNAILFCDSCNIPVHQDCYGVPFIPEGQWLCRRCQISPSRPVDCIMCPSKTGAFKQTEDSRWGHAVCALWVPECRFANEIILEPITDIDKIPKARWNLRCNICGKKGACIQCAVKACCTAYHATCAQKLNYYMKILEDDAKTGETKNISYCDAHTPKGWGPLLTVDQVDLGHTTAIKNGRGLSRTTSVQDASKETLPHAMPIVPMEHMTALLDKYDIEQKQPFLSRLIGYWAIKRQSRSGVPLLRRLHAGQSTRGNKDESTEGADSMELKKRAQNLRVTLERLRLLAELVAKREKMKRELWKIKRKVFEQQMFPLVPILRNALSSLRKIDADKIFHMPVDTTIVTDYLILIEHPMDLSTVGRKIENHEYKSLDEFRSDVMLIVDNAMKYNDKSTVYYKHAQVFKRKAGPIVKTAMEQINGAVIDEENGIIIPPELIPAPVAPEEEEISSGPASPGPHTPLKQSVSQVSASTPGVSLGSLYEEMTKMEERMAAAMKISNFGCRTARMHHLDKAINEVYSRITQMGGTADLSTINTMRAEFEADHKERMIKRKERHLAHNAVKVKKETSGEKRGAPVNGFGTPPSGHKRPRLTSKQNAVSLSSSPVHAQGSAQSGRGRPPGSKVQMPNATPLNTPSKREMKEQLQHIQDHAGKGKKIVPGDIVWAKVDRLPWYPAEVMDDVKLAKKAQKGGGEHVPPLSVLELKSQYDEPVRLISFLDSRRSWGWAGMDKMVRVGDEKTDSALLASSKSSKRLETKRALEQALEMVSAPKDGRK